MSTEHRTSDAARRPRLLALNSGSSARKFGLYRVGSSQVDTPISGGVGEDDPGIRAEICSGLRRIGILLDEARNRGRTHPISDPGPRCAVLVLASQEDEQIVRHTGVLFANLLTRFNRQKSQTGR